MIDILYIVLPIYLAIALGFTLVKTKAFSDSDMRIIGRFVINVAFPALIFQAMATRPLSEVLNADYMLPYALSGLAVMAISYVTFGALGWETKIRAAGVMGSSCPNNGFVGYAFFLLAMPDLAPVILALNLVVENLLIVPLCMMLMRSAETERGGGLRRIGRIFLSVLKTPLIIALLTGTLVNFLNIPVPGPAKQFISILAAAASALGLVVIGAALASLPPGTSFVRAGQVVSAKILLSPAIAFAITYGLTAAGVIALSPNLFAAVILSAAMPTFGIFVVFTQRLNLEGFASLVLFGSTLGAFVTLSALLTWLT
ncbi:AEC family transporter [Cognatishimia activa]|uniref:AEC family transporter n=1 Tax=Cognatishimia activa TaxID=1715691 RepID=A0A975I8E9_9RHOB|nr:AEC family transporter [Cognatishimia activa]QTN36987.1 AEC family transporter [Cognatishimia activa]